MPKLADAILAQHYDSVIKLAAKNGGVSRMELMSGLGVTRIVADKLIEHAKLVPGPKVGRTEFFKVAANSDAPATVPTLPDGATAGVLIDDSNKPKLVTSTPVAVVAADPPVAPKTPPLDDDDKVEKPDVAAEIDEQIVAVKKLVASDCAELGKAHERLVLHQAMLTALLTRRVAL